MKIDKEVWGELEELRHLREGTSWGSPWCELVGKLRDEDVFSNDEGYVAIGEGLTLNPRYYLTELYFVRLEDLKQYLKASYNNVKYKIRIAKILVVSKDSIGKQIKDAVKPEAEK